MEDPNPISHYMKVESAGEVPNESRNTYEHRTSVILKNVGECPRPDTFMERVIEELIRIARESSGQRRADQYR